VFVQLTALLLKYLAANKRFGLTAHFAVCNNFIGPVNHEHRESTVNFSFVFYVFFCLRMTLQ